MSSKALIFTKRKLFLRSFSICGSLFSFLLFTGMTCTNDVNNTCEKQTCVKDSECQVGEYCMKDSPTDASSYCHQKSIFCIDDSTAANDRGDVMGCNGYKCSNGTCARLAESNSDCTKGYSWDGKESCVSSGASTSTPLPDSPIDLSCRADCTADKDCKNGAFCIHDQCFQPGPFCKQEGLMWTSIQKNPSSTGELDAAGNYTFERSLCGHYGCNLVSGLCFTDCVTNLDCATGNSCDLTHRQCRPIPGYTVPDFVITGFSLKRSGVCSGKAEMTVENSGDDYVATSGTTTNVSLSLVLSPGIVTYDPASCPAKISSDVSITLPAFFAKGTAQTFLVDLPTTQISRCTLTGGIYSTEFPTFNASATFNSAKSTKETRFDNNGSGTFSFQCQTE